MQSKPIVLLGGVAGVGKTTLANYLSHIFPFDHNIGTGFIREALLPILPREKYPALHTFSFRPPNNNIDIIDHYVQQCEILLKPIEACISRAHREGTSLIIEGSNLNPTLLDLEQVDVFIILVIKDKVKLKCNILGETHIFRHINDEDFNNILKIQEYLLEQTKKIQNQRLFVVENNNYELTRKFVIDIITKRNRGFIMTNDSITNSIYINTNKENNKQALLLEYDKRFDYELNSIERRWQMLTVFIAVSGFSLAIYKDTPFKITLTLFNILTGLCSIAYWIQVRSRAYANDLRLKEVAETLGIVGLVHIQRKERLLRFSGVSFYAVLFMIILTFGWFIILISAMLKLPIP